jgi:uncharacterized membrane protein
VTHGDPASAWFRSFTRLQPAAGDHRVALRAGISVLVPLLTVITLGHPQWTPYAAFGAFPSVYGRNHVHLSRAAMQLSVAAVMVTCVALGAWVGTFEERSWLTVVVGALVAAFGSLVSTAEDWHPPGPLFLVFAFGAVASVRHSVSEILVAVGVAAASAAFAVLVGNVGAFVRGQRSRPIRLAPVWTWQPVRLAVATLAAGGIATAAGIGHPYWAMVAAVAPLTARSIDHQLLRAGHRIVGTLVGLMTAAALLAPGFDPVPTVLLVAALQIATELLIGRNYGLALLFITPMALLLGQLAAPRPVGALLFDRGVETMIGAAVAITLIVVVQLRLDGRLSR